MSSNRAAYDASLARMTAAVQALPARRRDEMYELVAAHLDTVTTAVERQPGRRRTAVVSSCRPVAATSREGGP